MYVCNTCQSDCTSLFNSQQLVYIDISLNCTTGSIDWITDCHSTLSSSTVQQLEPARICEHSNVLFHTIVEKSWTSLVMVSIIMKLYSTIVLTMNTGKYPICVCWPQAQSLANVAPMLLTRDAITQDCQCFRVMSYAGLTQTLWEAARAHETAEERNVMCRTMQTPQVGSGHVRLYNHKGIRALQTCALKTVLWQTHTHT